MDHMSIEKSTLIWDSIRSVGYTNEINGYGKLFKN